MKVTKPLLRGTKIKFEGDSCWVEFKYEQLPLFCLYCGLIGNEERTYGRKNSNLEKSILKDGQYGKCLIARNRRGSNKGKIDNKREDALRLQIRNEGLQNAKVVAEVQTRGEEELKKKGKCMPQRVTKREK